MTNVAEKQDWMSGIRGRMTENAPLGAVGWFRCGGTADMLFKPEDQDDLAAFMASCPPDMKVQSFGVMSNSIIRDGGVRGAVIRLGREFAGIEVLDNNRIRAGAMALDGNVAMAAAKAGIAGLEFYSGIPGTIGGALRMNAGCYGTETKDVLIEATAIDRQGNAHVFKPVTSSRRKSGSMVSFVADGEMDSGLRRNDEKIEMNLSYRHNSLPEDYIFVSAVFEGREGDPEAIKAHMAEIKERRNDSQPIREKTGGSTFANPSAEQIAAAGLPEGTKVWQLIDRAGCRGLMVGGAQMSELHCNFMINTGTATAADLENLGEEVRRRVYEDSGIKLRWEIRRIGEK